MKDFLESLIKSIVEKPDAVSISEERDQQDRQLLVISVDPEDMGRVIGKSGKVINSVRTIMRVVAIRQGVKIRVDVKDDSPAPQLQETPPQATNPSAAELVQSQEEVTETSPAETTPDETTQTEPEPEEETEPKKE